MKLLRTAILGVLAVVAVPAISAESAPAAATATTGATGKWLASVDAGGMAVELTFNLKAEGEKLTGTLDVNGMATPISDGTVKGEDVAFKLAFDTGQGGPPIQISYVGKLKSDQITLRSSFSMGEGTEPMVTDLVAKRAK
jgi:hypothetical protein